MSINKKYQKRIEEVFKDIFKTEIQKGTFNSLTTVVKEPLVKHQIIQLAKLCEEIPANVNLKNTTNGVFIEFW
ncbi:hypothetical protein [Flavivirga algicola]|uniref:Uncharacterized protein n=1 Tax=Flavivirga algicola TaxID=2729136 RepID=A0ABX1RY29_9FLAO|nr:hypothetical protein [Flavivirga algicola]NMH87322.1 hypothetical protein [Flavivirga algicola]